MGQKKKPPPRRSKSSPSPSSTTAVVAVTAETDVEPSEISPCSVYDGGFSKPSDSAEIKQACEKALMSFQRGNYNKALRLMKDSCSRHNQSALIHRVRGTLFVKVASVFEDLAAKQRHLRSAIDSASKAVELSPNSIEFGHFYANLLYEAANDGSREYDEVLQECQRALSIENPIDPARESLQDENQQKISTPEARIAHVQDELRSLVQKSNIASFSTWVRTLGNSEDKFRVIPIRRVAEDPIESNLIQARRPNEIKKATKTPEERRKEIEVRVAAVKLMQQKTESSPSDNAGNANSKGSDPTVSGERRSGERRKHVNARKNSSQDVRKDRVRLYWDSLSREAKGEFLRVKVSDLKSYFGESKDSNANEIISEALSFCESNKTWRFWVCSRCSEKFMDSEAHMQHIVQEHLGNVLPKMQMVLPQILDSERIETLLSFPWKPLDLAAAVRLLSSQKKIQNSELNESYSGNNMEDGDNLFKDAWNDTSPEKENLVDACNGYDENESEDSKLLTPFPPPGGWPISDDPERAKLLAKIRAAFELLIRYKYLATSHHDKVIQFTLDELRNIASVSQLVNRGLNQSPVCICFLGAIQLKKILKYLQDLSQTCGLSQYAENNPNDEANIGDMGLDVTEQILLDGEDLCLHLDDKLLGTECSQEKHMGSALNNGAIESSGDTANGNNVSSCADGILSWIFTGASSGEQILSWMRTNDEKKNQGLEIMQILEKEFCYLQNLCERKCEHLSYEGALQTVEDLCLDESRKRETSAEFTHESYDSVLRKRRGELNESDHELVFLSSRFELEAITNVLKDAEPLNHGQFGYEESSACTNSQLRDLESGELDEWGMKDSFKESDRFIEIAIQKQKEQLCADLSRIDAQMMRIVTGVQQLEQKLGPVSSNDYQIVLLSLVKSYMRTHLEALAEKDATEKSDAVREALLIELDLDSKEALGRNDNSKHRQEKSKDKKKNKDIKKLKDLKATTGNNHFFNADSTERSSSLSPVASNGDHSGDDVVFKAIEASKEQQEEYRRQIELEEEERTLEKTLEYQRRVENEAKEKHIAEQQKKYSSLVPMNVAEAMYTVCRDNVTDDLGLQEQEKYISQENVTQRNGLCDDLGGTRVYTNGVYPSTNHCLISDAATLEDVKSQKVVNNGVATQAGSLQSDQRTGRRSRRQKASNKLIDGKDQVTPSESKNSEAQRSSTDSERQSETLCSNGGTKTLRQLQAEEDDEERYQADLKKAVRQSLDAYQGGRNMTPFLRAPFEVNTDGVSDVTKQSLSSTEDAIFGTGLQNEVGEYNCFLNVIIQSLWNLELFRAEFLRSSTLEHHHVGDPCVVCSLYEIFTALSAGSSETRKEPVAPSSLRIALSNLYPNSSFFQEAQMNDASEVLSVIFDCLHRSFSQSSSVSVTESSESSFTGSWDCANRTCIAHSLFGMDISEQMSCFSCGLESRHMKYTSFFYNINASALRTMKVTCAGNSFAELLNLVEINHQLACDPEAGGCGKPNRIQHILTTPPHVFTTVLGWQNTCESVEDISATLAALNTEIDISVMYRGLDPKCTYRLVSVVCYYGQHYHCFAYSHEHDRWIMYDDKTVKVVGDWIKVLSMCERGHLQPQVLLYERRR